MDKTYNAIQAAPPVAVSALSFMELGLDIWVYILTIVYLILQIGVIVLKVLRNHGGKWLRKLKLVRKKK